MNSLSGPNLVNLVDHLRELESGFTSILFETVLKLSTLTDTSVFLLVETPEGRKFGGKRHLCDYYAGQGLKSIGNDVECNIDASVSGLNERYLNSRLARQDAVQVISHANSLVPLPSSLPLQPPHLSNGTPRSVLGVAQTNKRKQSRPKSLSRQTFGSPTKRSRIESVGGGGCGADVNGTATIREAPLGAGHSSLDVEIKTETEMPCVFVGENDIREISLDDDDDDFAKSLDESSDALNSSLVKIPPNGLNTDSMVFEITSELDMASNPWSIKDYLDRTVKASAMLNMEAPIDNPMDPSCMEIERHSTFMKLLSSILYDSSKETAMACPIKMKSHPYSKKFFSAVYEEWFTYFTNLAELHSKGYRCLEGSRSYSVKTFCRNVMQRSFGYFLDRMK